MSKEHLARLYWHAAALNRECKATAYDQPSIRDLKFAADQIARCDWPALRKAAHNAIPIVVVHVPPMQPTPGAA